MHPNQYSNPLIRKWHEGNPAKSVRSLVKNNTVNSLTLHLLDGCKRTYFYMYLIKAELRLLESLNAILLKFNSEKVTLKGYRLHQLYLDIIDKKQSDLYISDKRYLTPKMNDKAVVIEVSFEEKKC